MQKTKHKPNLLSVKPKPIHASVYLKPLDIDTGQVRTYFKKLGETDVPTLRHDIHGYINNQPIQINNTAYRVCDVLIGTVKNKHDYFDVVILIVLPDR